MNLTYQLTAPMIPPTERHTFSFSHEHRWRCVRIASQAFALMPDVRFYHQRAKTRGSRRRGKRASWLWGAACLRHCAGGWHPVLAVEEITVDGLHNLLATIPFDVFAPSAAYGPLQLSAGHRVDISIRNLDERPVAAGFLVVGEDNRPMPVRRYRGPRLVNGDPSDR